MNSAVLKPSPRRARAVPPLTNGDHLTWPQFAERWDATPNLKKAELINGVVYMSPLTHQSGRAEDFLRYVMHTYEIFTEGVEGSGNSTWCMLNDAPQPDAYLRILREKGGQSWVEANYLHGAPELVAEACYTSAAYDLNEKMDLYRRAGVKEFVTVLIAEKEIRWHRLERKRYARVALPNDGVFRSRVFPGLWLNAHALLRQNMKTVLATLNKGLKSPEHQKFAARLRSKAK